MPSKGNGSLITFWLEATALFRIVETEIQNFFHWYKVSAQITTIWDTFKAYMGVIFPCNAYKDKERGAVWKRLTEEVLQLEQENKQEVSLDRWSQIQSIYELFNLLVEHKIVQDIMYEKQKTYVYGGKAGKQLAWVLSECRW